MTVHGRPTQHAHTALRFMNKGHRLRDQAVCSWASEPAPILVDAPLGLACCWPGTWTGFGGFTFVLRFGPGVLSLRAQCSLA